MNFQGFLKQSTAVTVTVLLIDSADHITGKTGLAAGLTVYQSKAGAATGAITPTSVTEIDATNAKGLYALALNTTSWTNTLGEMMLHITATGTDPADYKWWITARLPDDLAFPATTGRSMVVDAAGLVDANMVKAGPTGAGTAQTAGDIPARLPAALTANGNIKASLVEILTTALTETAGQLAGGFKKFFNIATPASTMDHLTLLDTVTTATTATNLTNAPTAGDFTAAMKTSLNAATPTASLTTAESGIVQSGTAAAGAGSTITLQSALGADNICNGQLIKITGGTGVGQSRIIAGYVNATKVATVDYAWTTNPDNTSTYAIMHANLPALSSTALKVTEVALVDTVTTNTDMITQANVRTAVGLASANLDTQLGNIRTDTNTTIPALIAALNNLSAAQVKTQVVAALSTDTYAEPGQGTPTATIDLATKISYLFKFAINKMDQTATLFQVYNNAGAVVDQKAAVSDDGVTFTRAKLSTGP